MREKYSMYQDMEFPEFLVEYLPKCMRFVRRMRKNFVNSSEDQLEKFAKHLIISFYLEHGDITRIEGDLDSLLNENKGHYKE